MKKLFFLLFLLPLGVSAQTIKSNNKDLDRAFALAVRIVDTNIHNGILAAGADYGGEWTRDCAINAWNGVSLLRPAVAEKSLWSVTNDRKSIGHQYWDHIIWTIGALNHYKVNGDTAFLRQARNCAATTMLNLEKSQFDKKWGLFKGPSVFNDGIAAYPEPIFDSTILRSGVLDHKGAADIKCLSTNCLYFGAYKALDEMDKILNIRNSNWNTKAGALQSSIIKNFRQSADRYYYLIDQNGKKAEYQEGLGISFAVVFGVVKGKEAEKLIQNAYVTLYGISSIFPDFPRFSPEKPGRHNNIIWPMVNGYYAKAATMTKSHEVFAKEFNNLIGLALDANKGNGDFKEIYNPYTGAPDGGWQSNFHWKSCNKQTWSATAYMDMVMHGIIGLRFNDASKLSFEPYLPKGLNSIQLSGINYRNSKLNISLKGRGGRISKFLVNGQAALGTSIPANSSGDLTIEIELIEG